LALRAIIQRVKESSVTIDEQVVAQIGTGLMVLVGIENEDQEEDIQWLVNKITQLRIFGDENGLMNLSVQDVEGEILLVSQFTLHASIKKGTRPSFIKAAKPDVAIPLYEKCIKNFEEKMPGKVKTGKFGADMKVALVNDGPVTLFIDTKNKN
jgi:D-tyrosyl-tRNA(Tyr) deacylase